MYILYSVKSPDQRTNPFIVLLRDSISPAANVMYFSWWRALFGRYDVFHVHWPENLFRTRGLARVVKGMLAWTLVFRLLVLRTPVLWTVHNNRPHETGGPVESLFLKVFEGLVSHRVAMNHAQAEAFADGGRWSVIRHGHYRKWLESHPHRSPVDGRILFWGILRPYKGVERLVASFRKTVDPTLSLHLAGKPSTSGFEYVLGLETAVDPRITTRFGYLSDAELVAEITSSVITVLPYRNIVNSGVALYSLSLNRPILIPTSRYAHELSSEVGEGWVRTFDGELQPADLLASVEAASTLGGTAPDLRAFEWGEIGKAYIKLYRSLTASS